MIRLKHKLLTALLALLLLLPSIPALAQEAQPGQVTTHFVGLATSNCTLGFALAPAQTRQGEPLTAPELPGRTFLGYEQETTHVYSLHHLPYIQGLVQNTIPLTLANSMLSRLITNAKHCEKASNSNQIVSNNHKNFSVSKADKASDFALCRSDAFDSSNHF